jgi:hypothetical protein
MGKDNKGLNQFLSIYLSVLFTDILLKWGPDSWASLPNLCLLMVLNWGSPEMRMGSG